MLGEKRVDLYFAVRMDETCEMSLSRRRDLKTSIASPDGKVGGNQHLRGAGRAGGPCRRLSLALDRYTGRGKLNEQARGRFVHA